MTKLLYLIMSALVLSGSIQAMYTAEHYQDQGSLEEPLPAYHKEFCRAVACID